MVARIFLCGVFLALPSVNGCLQPLPLGVSLTITPENSGFYSIKGMMLEEFKNKSGTLTLKAVDINQEHVPEWLKEKIIAARSAQNQDKWKEVCEILGSLYDCTDEEDSTVPDQFSETLAQSYISACLRLFEEPGDTQKEEMLEFNLCHSFFTEEAPKVWRAFSFDSQSRKAGDPEKLNPCLLSTAGVYLYLLGRSWQDGDEFDPTKFGEMYREPAQFLKDNKPNKGFISWILDRAFDDKNTQERLQRRRIAPVLY